VEVSIIFNERLKQTGTMWAIFRNSLTSEAGCLQLFGWKAKLFVLLFYRSRIDMSPLWPIHVLLFTLFPWPLVRNTSSQFPVPILQVKWLKTIITK